MQLNIYRSCFCLLCASSSPSIFIPLGVLGALIFSFQMKIIRENLLLKKSDIFSPDKMSQFCHQVELQHDKMMTFCHQMFYHHMFCPMIFVFAQNVFA